MRDSDASTTSVEYTGATFPEHLHIAGLSFKEITEGDRLVQCDPCASVRSIDVTATPDEVVAARSPARLLITAATPPAVEMIARRVHAASMRAAFPFVRAKASDFPLEPRQLKSACAALLDAAMGGSLFVTDVERLPPTVQPRLIGVLQELERRRVPGGTVRLISGTTVRLRDRVAAGTFSEPVFYQLNTLHLES